MNLWWAAGLLLVSALLVLLGWPTWRARRGASGGGAATTVRRQIAQLAALRDEGVLSADQHDEARAALERRLVQLVTAVPGPEVAAEDPQARPRRPSARLALALSAFMALVATIGYLWLGTPQALDGRDMRVAAGPDDGAGGRAAHELSGDQVEAMTQRLASRLAAQPGDAEGWAMLGRSYAVLGQHARALPAFERAVALRADDAVLLADYADALAAANDRRIDGEALKLVNRALDIEPGNLKALSLSGTAAFNRGDYEVALAQWEKMLKIAPDSEFSRQIQGGIDEARSRIGVATSGSAARPVHTPVTTSSTRNEPPAGSAPASTAAVSGRVTLSPTLAAHAAPEDTVFVYARAAQGPRMPLAILRKQVKDLPLSFTLDDSLSMSPAAKLSSAREVVVGARISKSGGATAQAGDLQGLSATVPLGAGALEILINEVVAR